MTYHELSSHCLCDNCTGEDCGQDNPEEYEREQEKERAVIRKTKQDTVLDDFEELAEHYYRAYLDGEPYIEKTDFKKMITELRRVSKDDNDL